MVSGQWRDLGILKRNGWIIITSPRTARFNNRIKYWWKLEKIQEVMAELWSSHWIGQENKSSETGNISACDWQGWQYKIWYLYLHTRWRWEQFGYYNREIWTRLSRKSQRTKWTLHIHEIKAIRTRKHWIICYKIENSCQLVQF